jgi:hypothetical protein
VRRFSSTDKLVPMEKLAEENPIPLYWVRQEKILSSEPGMHRFVWDLHYAPPESLTHEFPISAVYHDTVRGPLGAWVMPGEYSAKLTAGPRSFLIPFAVEMDPRIKTGYIDLRKQFEMESGSVDGMNQSYEALAQVRSVRAQLKERAAKAGKGALAEKIATLDKQAAELEGAAQSSFYGLPPSGKPPENFSTLNQHFSGILGVADSGDAAPTTQATAVFGELRSALESLQSRWKKMKNEEIPSLNKELKKAGLTEIDLSKPPSESPATDPDGDDKP